MEQRREHARERSNPTPTAARSTEKGDNGSSFQPRPRKKRKKPHPLFFPPLSLSLSLSRPRFPFQLFPALGIPPPRRVHQRRRCCSRSRGCQGRRSLRCRGLLLLGRSPPRRPPRRRGRRRRRRVARLPALQVPQHRHLRAHRRREDDVHGARAVLHGQVVQDRRGARR